MEALQYLQQNFWQILEAVSTAIAAIFAWRAFRQARQLFKSQQELANTIHQQQMLLAQRQLFVPLFEQLKGIAKVNPDDPVWPDVVAAVNFLDLLGTCWEGQLVDESVLFRVFRNFVIEAYVQVRQCKNPIPREKDGKTLLEESLPATALYKRLIREQSDQERPEPIR